MILRSITQHLKDQNWFAVVLDFSIVVIGILLAFQITNWNEAQQTKINEQAILKQLESEFTEIKTELEKQISVREVWAREIGSLIKILEGNDKAEDSIIKSGLDAATATGRTPAQSAAYLQLMASGELSMISNELLRQSLVKYDVRLQRDSFIHPALMKLVTLELSTNVFVEKNVLTRTRSSASIDERKGAESLPEEIRSYNLEELRKLENRYETMYVLHISLLSIDEVQLSIANQILDQISNEVR